MTSNVIEMPPENLGAKIDRLDRHMREGFAESRAELDRNIKEVRGEIKEVRVELDQKIDGVRAELGQKIEGVRVELDTTMDAKFAGLASEIGKIYRLGIIALYTVVGAVVAAVIGAIVTAVATGLVP